MTDSEPNWTIWSAPRTGSTALNHWVRHHLGLTHRPWNEPHWNGRWREFEQWVSSGQSYICKLHALHLGEYPEPIRSQLLANQAVRIRRRSWRDQLASMYLASQRGFWQGYLFYQDRPTEWDQQAEVRINLRQLWAQAEELVRYNRAVEAMTLDWRFDLWYEDLEYPPTTQFRPTPKPKNYPEILEASQRILTELGRARGDPLGYTE